MYYVGKSQIVFPSLWKDLKTELFLKHNLKNTGNYISLKYKNETDVNVLKQEVLMQEDIPFLF